jgi:O-antigen ligase
MLALATLGAGGARAGTLLAWHGLLVALVLAELLAPRPSDTGLDGRTLLAFTPFVAVVLVGAVLAPYGYAAWLTLLELAAFLAVAGLAARRGEGLLERLAGPLTILAAAQAGLALLQRFAGSPALLEWMTGGGTTAAGVRMLGDPRPAGTFLNPNHLAAWLAAVLLLIWGGWRGSRRAESRRATLLYGAASLPILLALVLTGSRGALLGFAGGAAAATALAWPRLAAGRRGAILWGGAVALLVVGALVLVPRLLERDPFRYQRLRIWRASLQAAIDSPWLGTGPNQFGAASDNLQFPDGHGPLRYDRSFSSPHSDLLRAPVELGWPGLVALTAAALAAAGDAASCPGPRRARSRH